MPVQHIDYYLIICEKCGEQLKLETNECSFGRVRERIAKAGWQWCWDMEADKPFEESLFIRCPKHKDKA